MSTVAASSILHHSRSGAFSRRSQFLLGDPSLLTGALRDQGDRIDTCARTYAALELAHARSASPSPEDEAVIRGMVTEVEDDRQLLQEVLASLRSPLDGSDASACAVASGPSRDARASALAGALSDSELLEADRWHRLLHLAEASGLPAAADAFCAAGRRAAGRRLQLGRLIERWQGSKEARV